jgi:serine/threonine-protein kinase RsbW
MLLAQDQKIKIKSKIENTFLVERLIEDVCDQMDLSRDHFGNLMVAVSEAVINSIQHGNKNIPEKEVTLDFKANDNFLSFTIQDEGNGFDFKNLPDPTLPENLEKANGRGIFLMRNLADHIQFNETGNSVELRFNLK